jgi:hypothetical protein
VPKRLHAGMMKMIATYNRPKYETVYRSITSIESSKFFRAVCICDTDDSQGTFSSESSVPIVRFTSHDDIQRHMKLTDAG